MINRSLGFTLIELLLIIAIISVIGVLSAPFYSRFLTQNSVANTSDQLTMQLRKAQIYAMAGKQNTSWGVRFESDQMTLFATSDAAFDETFSVNSNISINGFSLVTFAKASGAPNINPTITVSGGNNSRTISVNSQGAVSR